MGDYLSCTRYSTINYGNCCYGDDVLSEMCGGKVDAIWDINSLVAMPMDSWERYVIVH